MNTERMFAAATFQFAQKNHFIIYLLHRYIVILDALERFLHLVQLMIMSGKQRTCLGFRMLVNMLHNSPSNGNTIISGGSPSQLIKQHQTTAREVVQNICRLIHFNHKGRFAHRNVIAGSHTGEYFIHHTDPRTFGRNKTTHLRQQGNQRSLA